MMFNSTFKAPAKQMKRSEFKARSKPMARGDSQLARTAMKKRAPKKREGHDKPVRSMCCGQSCYLMIHCSGAGGTMPCHTNELALGKGMGLKAPDEYTVPGCAACHRELDQGKDFTKEEKKQIWREAYARWAPVRKKLFGLEFEPLV